VLLVPCVLTFAAALAWLYLLALHGGYWRTGHRLPPGSGAVADPWPAVTAVIPARNEADIVPVCLPSVLGQDYPGQFTVVLVDDDSTDGTAKAAAAAAADVGWRTCADADTGGTDRALIVINARGTPPGWAGKVWAMSEGVRAVPDGTDLILFTDADISYADGALMALVRAATYSRYALLSQMALLRTRTRWEKLLIPAFVYFFAQLYPFPWVSTPRRRTAAAAGGCMLVDASVLAAGGGLAMVKGARIDDIALAKVVKRAGGRCWLGFSTDVLSERPYDRLADIWGMIARSAYTQLRYSPVVTAGAVAGLAWLYLLPPAAVLAGVGLLAAGGWTASAAWLTAAGLAGWLVMSVTYLPVLRLYGLSPARAPGLPLIAALYAAMTADSARRHLRGRGGEWKGRHIPQHQPR
jgi:hopene-associated glycosyltransferase HpnB